MQSEHGRAGLPLGRIACKLEWCYRLGKVVLQAEFPSEVDWKSFTVNGGMESALLYESESMRTGTQSGRNERNQALSLSVLSISHFWLSDQNAARDLLKPTPETHSPDHSTPAGAWLVNSKGLGSRGAP